MNIFQKIRDFTYKLFGIAVHAAHALWVRVKDLFHQAREDAQETHERVRATTLASTARFLKGQASRFGGSILMKVLPRLYPRSDLSDADKVIISPYGRALRLVS